MSQNTQIHIKADPTFQPYHSQLENGYFFWTYTITIENQTEKPVQLMSRHWIITNAEGTVEEVKGEGVIGQQPVINPGESFSYTSGCPLNTPTGTMRGTYFMKDHEGNPFEVNIPTFYLESEMLYH